MKDPELYLDRLEVEVQDHLDPAQPAVLDADHRAGVNFDSYFFSTVESRQIFSLAPLNHVDEVTDPVTLARFVPDEHSPRIDFESRIYYFAAAENRDAFSAEPRVYALPKRHMKGRARALREARREAALQEGG